MGKRGPKPSGVGTVVYYRRVKPEMVAALDKVLLSDGSTHMASGVPMSNAVTIQIKALLDDIGRLTKEVEEWKGKFEEAVGMTPDQNAAYWKAQFLKLKMSMAKGEFDQE